MARPATLLALLPVFLSLLAVSHPRQAIRERPMPGDTPEPPVLVNLSRKPNTVEVNITAAVTRLSIVPGVMTEAYAYNGRVPGPTLDLHEADHVIVHFRNELPEPTTVPWHGIHLPFESDGSPFHPTKPGETHIYEFTV